MSNPANRPVHPIWNIPPAWRTAGGMTRSSVAPAPVASTVFGVGIILAIAAPWLIHLVPVTGTPPGAILLPMFYAPMMAALMLRLPVAVAVSVAAPIISQYLTGMPPAAVLPSLMLQISIFVVALRVLRVLPWVVVVQVAYLIGLVSAALLTRAVGAAPIDVAGTIGVGWPGIAVLAGLGWLADRSLRGTTR